MNQILSTSMPMDNSRKKNKKVRNKQPVEISSVLRFFAIAILVFGVFMVATGTYAIYENQSEKKEQSIEPTIAIENKTDKVILLKVTHQRNIEKIEYRWNDEEPIVVRGNNGQYLEQQINVPLGTNTLHVLVQDEIGKQITYDKQYEVESNINIEVSGNKIKIKCESDTKIAYMTYRWDEEDEQTIQINSTTMEQEIEAMKGLHTLTVIVVDENNNTDTKEQKINGVSKPKLILDVDEQREHFVIKTSDEERLSKIEFVLNQEDRKYELNIDEMNLKELDYIVPMELQPGENIIQVTVYNSSGLSEERAVKFMK